MSSPTRLPADKVGRSSGSGSIGECTRCAVARNAAAASAATIRPPATGQEAQPCGPASIRPPVSAVSATMAVSCPAGSPRRSRAPSGAATRRRVSHQANTPTGMLTANTSRQLATVVSAPPSTGPDAAASPPTPPHSPTARARLARSG